MTRTRAGIIISDERWPRFCRPFLLRWFPYFFSLVVLIAVQSSVHAQDAAPPATTAPASSPAVPAVTAPAATAPTEDIRDIRGPISIPSPWRWLWVVAGITAVLALLYTSWRWYRLFATARAKTPYEIALDRLERARALMKPEQAREYSFAISEITREYIERRFGEHAARRTTDEFLHDLVHHAESPLAAHQSLLEEVLRYCDLAKFARWELDLSEMEALHESARTFITETRPEPESAKRAHSNTGPTPHTQPTIMGAMPAGRHS